MTTSVQTDPPVVLAEEDLAELRVSLRRALDRLVPLTHTASLMETSASWDRGSWTRLADEIGLPGIAVSATHSGQGFSRREQGVVLEELGRVLYGGPYLSSSAIAAGAIELTGDQQLATTWLPGLAAGQTLATLAVDEPGTNLLSRTFATTFTSPGDDEHVLVNGRKLAVIDGDVADLFLVLAADPDGAPVLVAVEAAQPGVDLQAEPALDLTRRLNAVTFTNARGRRIRPARDFHHLVVAVANLRGAALASEQVGAARAVLDLTIAYARTRIQFGREIGTFQAVRHRLADLHAEVEVAASTARSAAATPDLFTSNANAAAATAQSFCTETFLLVSEEAIQLHGGIGFTWEHPCHLFLKRAKSSELIFGDPAQHRSRLHDSLFTAEGTAS